MGGESKAYETVLPASDEQDYTVKYTENEPTAGGKTQRSMMRLADGKGAIHG
jgi:hypothetical protein